jgi:hypothetical protein
VSSIIIRYTDFIKTLNQAPIICLNCELRAPRGQSAVGKNMRSLTRKSGSNHSQATPRRSLTFIRPGFGQGDGARTRLISAIVTLSSSPVAYRHGWSPLFACSPDHSFRIRLFLWTWISLQSLLHVWRRNPSAYYQLTSSRQDFKTFVDTKAGNIYYLECLVSIFRFRWFQKLPPIILLVQCIYIQL